MLSIALALLAAVSGRASAAGTSPRALYLDHCAVCHGDSGRGDGLAALYLLPKPRDFTQGMYKIRTTASGELPADQDLLGTLARGMPGSAMPSFAALSEADRKALVGYIKSLAKDESGKPLFAGAKPRAVATREPPPGGPEAAARGRKVYEKAECGQCHGSEGRGDGPSAATLRDEWDNPIRAADLTRPVFRGGSSARDAYLRFTTGLNGTPMPAYEETLTESERWDLAHYVRSLAAAGTPEVPRQATGIRIRAAKSADAGSWGPEDPAWDKAAAAVLPLMHLWQGTDQPPFVRVRAAHDGKGLAVRLEWEDPGVDGLATRPQDFPDAAAVMFALTDPRGHFSMGSKGRPVNVWQWRMDRQLDLARFQDMEHLYASMAVDDYPLDADRYPKTEKGGHQPVAPASSQDPLFLAGYSAGNPMSELRRASAVEDLNAEGFGTLTAQPATGQDVRGTGAWSAGSWKVVFRRALAPATPQDAAFAGGRSVPAAFAVWNGAAGDRNGKKSVTYWQTLEIE